MSHQGQTSPRTKTIGLRQQAWWVMRKRVSFTVTELLATLATGAERDAPSNIGKYVRALEKVGIVRRDAARVMGPSLTSPGMLRYQLVINSGRKAPVWRAQTRRYMTRTVRLSIPWSAQPRLHLARTSPRTPKRRHAMNRQVRCPYLRPVPVGL